MILPPDQLHAIDRVAAGHTNLRIIIDHLAITSSRRDDKAFATLKELYPMARNPNFAEKAVGPSMFVADDEQGYVTHAVKFAATLERLLHCGRHFQL